MDWLEKNGEADNTIILFMSDNGGLASTSEWRDGPLYTQNYPLLSGKGSLCEGGIREPMIVSWPGVAQPNTRCDKYLLIEDFYPTILEMAGVKDYETVQPIDGISFVPLLTGTGDPPKAFPLLEYAEQLGQRRSGHQLQLCGPQWRLETDLLLRYRQERTVQHLRRYRRKERP